MQASKTESELQQQLDQSSLRLGESHKENEQLKRRGKSLESQLEQLQRENGQLSKELGQLKQFANQGKKQNSAYQSQISGLQEQVQSLQEQLETTLSKLGEANERIASANTSSSAQAQSHRRQLFELEQSCLKRIEQAEEKNKSEMEQVLQHMEQVKAASDKRIQELEKSSRDKVAKEQTSVKGKDQQLDKLKAELERVQSEKMELHTNLDVEKRKRQELQSQLSTLEHDNSQTDDLVNSTVRAMNAMEQKLIKMAETVAEKDHEILLLKETVHQECTERKELGAIIVTLKQRLKIADQKQTEKVQQEKAGEEERLAQLYSARGEVGSGTSGKRRGNRKK
eukprot:TRINITY_DN1450_c0_g1_i11.p1 TRINITY_DN1450_c0_g1~~TRINITY_DN1450_c0_g1_i11.p1  ORF type:complete len:340 (+),score=129.22 TRINITY_DN1450_c0_g1_i11:131-1150(+)